MAYQSVARNLPIAPRKLRAIVRTLRGKTVGDANRSLTLYQQKSARLLRRALQTAVHNGGLPETSQITAIEVGEGLKLKRFYLFGRGVARPYFKQRSHLRIIFDDSEKSQKPNSKKQINSKPRTPVK